MSASLEIAAKAVGKKHAVTASNGQPIYVDEINLTRAADRKSFAALVHKRVPAIKAKDVEAQLLQMAADSATRIPNEAPKASVPETAESLLAAMDHGVKATAQSMLEAPSLIQRIEDDIEAMGIAGEGKLTVLIYLVGVSRLLPKPLAAIVQGPTSSGKSLIIETVARLFPPEMVILATQMTPQALFHMKPGSLEHRFVVAGERSRIQGDDAAEATRALREMISSGELNKLMPEKNKDGVIETKSIHQKGPIAFIESTTMSKIFEEDANRCLVVQTDEREEQTKRIIEMNAARRSGTAAADIDGLTLRHHAAQRMLRSISVIIPFADKLGRHFPTDRVEARRAFGHLLNMVEVVALFHQFQRKVDQQGRLVAQVQDYVIAMNLLDAPMGQLLGRRISVAALRFLDRLKHAFPGPITFTTQQATVMDSVSSSAVKGWMRELSDAGHIEVVEPGRGPIPTTWKLCAGSTSEETTSLLPPVEVIQ